MKRVIMAALLACAGVTAAHAQEPAQHGHNHTAAARDVMPLLSGLGNWRVSLNASSGEARRFFEQGLRLAYAFNHDEARRSFERAIELDPACALCYWGIAYAVGPNINLPMEAAAERDAVAAITKARALSQRASQRERAYIDALNERFALPAGEQRATRDSAYAAAMKRLADTYPGDADAQVLYADALLNLRPWNQWTRTGSPQPGTLAAVAALERAMRLAPDHAGACHFWIHTVEASLTPERALACAEKLPKLMPGAGHIVHMPAHVYLRVGRYEDAAQANIAAVNADRGYFQARAVGAGIYPQFYHPHNLHFLWSAYLMSGQRAKARAAARALRERVTIADARATPSLQAFLTPEILTHARFADWDSVLAVPAPAEGMPYVTALWHFARGQAFTAKRDTAAAAHELNALRTLQRNLPASTIIILNPAPAVLKVAELVLAGGMAARAGDYERAVALLKEAAEREAELTYDEPPPWHVPVRQVLGQVLLDAQRPGDAVVVFREDLRWVPRNGWSLHGLETALRKLGRDGEADAVARELAVAWKHADVPPHAR